MFDLMESKHPVVEINLTKLLLRKFGNLERLCFSNKNILQSFSY